MRLWCLWMWPKRDVTEGRIGQDRARDGGVAADHDVLLGAVAGLVDREVADQDRRHIGPLPDLRGERPDVRDHGVLERGVELVQAFSLLLLFAQQGGAQRIRRGRDLERLPAAADDLDDLLPVADVDVGHIQRAEDVDAGGALGDRGQVVVAHQHDHRDAGVRDLLDAPRKLALVRGVRVARLVRVTGEDEDVHALLDRVVADVAQPAQEVHDARVDPGCGVDPPVVFHADVNVGGVEEFDGLHVLCLVAKDRRDADERGLARKIRLHS